MSARWKRLEQTINEAAQETDVYYRDPFTVAVVTINGKNLTTAQRKELGITATKKVVGVGATKRMRYARKYDSPDPERAKNIAVKRAHKDILKQVGLL